MKDKEKKYWLGFSAFPGIGPLRFKLLLNYFGSANKAWEAERKDLLGIGLGTRLTEKFCQFRNSFSFDKYLENLSRKNIQIMTLADKNYPHLLSQISDAPFVLYIRGKLDWDCSNAIGVVGTRKVTNYGTSVTRKLVEGLVDNGITIVSGLAYGVDAVAHETAVAMNGKTIAVLGCGVDIVHPVSNSTLYWTIIKKNLGCIISEFPPGMIAEKGLFPARNRIISGLSLGVVVTEGASDSGALITARYAAEQGREVFAVPGPITSQMSLGPTILLKQGAKMVTEVSDILEELNIRNKPIDPASPAGRQLSDKPISEIIKNLTNEERKIFELLQNECKHFDELVKKTGFISSKLGSLLTIMEMKKIIVKSNEGYKIYG